MSEKRKAVVFGVKCAGCGRMRYLNVKPAAGPYRCKRCRPARPANSTATPTPGPSRDPFYADDARRAEVAARAGRGPWLPRRPDWLHR